MSAELDAIRKAIDETDRSMAGLFRQRLALGLEAARCKQAAGLPLYDAAREATVLQRNVQHLGSEEIKPYYEDFLREVMRLTRAYEYGRQEDAETVVKRGALSHLAEYISLDRRVMLVSDSGVPEMYRKTVLDQCPHACSFVFEPGESHKTLSTVEALWADMTARGFTRSDLVIALGGGVVGDLAGFAAACYQRGVAFCNLPTTLLAQVDACVGGKTGIDFRGLKNQIGVFRPAEKVIIDTETLLTLPPRIFREGVAELLKMGVTLSRPLFEALRDADPVQLPGAVEPLVAQAIRLKSDIVKADPFERNLRRVLNFGHTVGHAVEAAAGGRLFHGECVAIGMPLFCSPEVRAQLLPVLEKYALPTVCPFDADTLLPYIAHDKKRADGVLHAVFCGQIGRFDIQAMSMNEMENFLKNRLS